MAITHGWIRVGTPTFDYVLQYSYSRDIMLTQKSFIYVYQLVIILYLLLVFLTFNPTDKSILKEFRSSELIQE